MKKYISKILLFCSVACSHGKFTRGVKNSFTYVVIDHLNRNNGENNIPLDIYNLINQYYSSSCTKRYYECQCQDCKYMGYAPEELLNVKNLVKNSKEELILQPCDPKYRSHFQKYKLEQPLEDILYGTPTKISNNQIAMAYPNGLIGIWNYKNRSLDYILDGYINKTISCVSYLGNNKLISTTWSIQSAIEPNTLMLWDLTTQKLLLESEPFNYTIDEFVLIPEKNIYCCSEESIKIWNIKSNTFSDFINVSDRCIYSHYNKSHIHNLAYCGEGFMILCLKNNDTDNTEPSPFIYELAISKEFVMVLFYNIKFVEHIAPGIIATVDFYDKLQIWDFKKYLRDYFKKTKIVTSFRTKPAKLVYSTTGEFSIIKLWEKTFKEIENIKHIGGGLLAVDSCPKFSIWDINKRSLIKSIEKFSKDPIFPLYYLGNGSVIYGTIMISGGVFITDLNADDY